MSDYTPTTEDVRAAWTHGYHGDNYPGAEGTGTEFDRWLAAHDAALRAEWEAEQGTEEPEWEYGYGSIADAEAERPTMRRRKAGPWMPVEQEKP